MGGGGTGGRATRQKAFKKLASKFRKESTMLPSSLSMNLCLYLCNALTATLSATASGTKSSFGLEIIGKHASGCLIVKSTKGKAAECGIRELDLICKARGRNLTADSMRALPRDSTSCAAFTVRQHSNPCPLIPLETANRSANEFGIGLRLSMKKLPHPNNPEFFSNVFSVESVAVGSAASGYPISPGDWIRSIDGQLLFRKEPDAVERLMQGGGGSAVEVCHWSNERQLSNLPEHAESGSATSPISSIFCIHSPHEMDWSVKGILAASFVGVIIIVLLFRKPQHKTTPPPPPPYPYPLPPVVEKVVRDLNNPDPSTQAKAEAELKEIFDDESLSEKQKSDVRSAVIHAGMLTKWAEELEEPFLRNRLWSAATLQDFGDRWKDRLIHLCNMIALHAMDNILATTPQERKTISPPPTGHLTFSSALQ